jgi:hypothetical protein
MHTRNGRSKGLYGRPPLLKLTGLVLAGALAFVLPMTAQNKNAGKTAAQKKPATPGAPKVG